jgi:hypothetical protein
MRYRGRALEDLDTTVEIRGPIVIERTPKHSPYKAIDAYTRRDPQPIYVLKCEWDRFFHQ